ncbi:aspartic peptidase domain-containing protein [Mycena galopus ATCC 62051]|nr:aspartic peptidase domain-containing protein [Mycena galopus ATCC 62051]
MVLATAVVLSLAICAATAEFNVVRHVSHAPRSLAPAVIPAAQFVVPIISKAPRRQSKKSNLASLRANASPNNTAVLEGADLDQEYLTNVTIGGQTFTAIIVPQKAVIKKGFKCFNLTNFPESTQTCGFGSNGFDTAASSTFKPFPKVSFNISYGDGEFLSGPVGFDTVSVGGLSVTQQEIGTPDLAAWEGDGVNSGLIGLAFSSLTSVFNTSDPTKASNENHISYDPFFFTAVKQGAVANPFFSLALNRGALAVNTTVDANLGFLAFGGMPPVDLDKTAVTVPIQGYSASTGDPSNKNAVFLYYTVDVEGYTFPGSTKVTTKNNNTIVDSGTTLNYLPNDVAKAYNERFVPKAKLDEDSGLWFVDCNATVPAFSVTLGGKSFPIDARDQILENGTDDAGNLLCISGTQPGGEDTPDTVFILGDVFQHNVVSTFNIQTDELTITRRKKY